MSEYVTGIGDGYYWWFEDTESMTDGEWLRLCEYADENAMFKEDEDDE